MEPKAFSRVEIRQLSHESGWALFIDGVEVNSFHTFEVAQELDVEDGGAKPGLVAYVLKNPRFASARE